MKIEVVRSMLNPTCTIGELSIDGEFVCFTLEDVVRPEGASKVFGRTAIPYGTYALDVTHSPHFGRELPLVVDVPGFEGIRIHPGNTEADTDGCLLVGFNHTDGSVTESRLAFDAVFARIEAARAADDPITIEYKAV